ncbi:CerR family C-terminal domain-containing protein [Bremerella sp. T1]|uniref:CerR family C-terminal domain-containing protein n=1 Tax=Bremerella sp. TYQ1 TaxID=3119568 RepID=UPI001CCBC8EB|nr:CerR family C-terminal domain-containing protein [Bremerella volcania]UBM35126.1 CerR family C-terminal domain-containing protein [Bremerella volcania]
MNSSQPDAKQRLLDAAIQEFALHGYDHGTVRRICGRADVNVNAVKYYFEDKKGLYIEAVKEAHRARHRSMAPSGFIPPGDDPSMEPEVRLKGFIRQMVGMAMSAQDRIDHKHLLIFREMSDPSGATKDIVQEFIQPHFERLDGILRQLLPADTSDADRHMFGFSVVGQCMHYKMAGPIINMLISQDELQALTADRVSDHIFQVISAAIAYRHRTDSA